MRPLAMLIRLQPSVRHLPSAVRFMAVRSASTQSSSKVFHHPLDKTKDDRPPVPSYPKGLKNAMLGFQSRVGEDFQNEELLCQALTHRSYSLGFHNGRLALLGQSLARQFVTEYLYVTYPRLNDSMMTDIVLHCTNKANVANIARQMGIEPALAFAAPSDGSVKKTKQNVKPTSDIIADGYYGVLGAILMDKGNLQARAFLSDTIGAFLAESDLEQFVKFEHPKFILQKILKQMNRQPCVTKVVAESGRGTHLPTFIVGVFSGDEQLGTGGGWSIKQAEKHAVSNVLAAHFLTEVQSIALPSMEEDFQPEDSIQIMVTGRSGKTNRPNASSTQKA